MATQLAPEHVVGRDRLIERAWHALEKHSVLFTAERRIGKTTVMKKMQAETPDGVTVRYLDLEKVGSPIRFVEVLLAEVRSLLPKSERAKKLFGELMGHLGGVEIGGVVKLPANNGAKWWQPALERVLACVCEHAPTTTLVLFFDELPYMLQKIAGCTEEGGDRAALAVLDVLRSARQEHPNLRMVFSGSIGLHHVVHALRDGKCASEPTSDMMTIEIGPLEASDAQDLARRLLSEARVECDSVDTVAAELADLTDRVPFYIERVAMCLALEPSPITPETVQRQVQSHLTNDLNHWEMEHFRQRIPTYYPGTIPVGDRATLAKADIVSCILDELSICESPRSIAEVCVAIKSSHPVENRALVIDLLRNLVLDHYLVCNDHKHYSFRFPLIRKWWQLAQGLAA